MKGIRIRVYSYAEAYEVVDLIFNYAKYMGCDVEMHMTSKKAKSGKLIIDIVYS